MVPEKLVPGEEFDGHTTLYYLLKYCLNGTDLQNENGSEYNDNVLTLLSEASKHEEEFKNEEDIIELIRQSEDTARLK